RRSWIAGSSPAMTSLETWPCWTLHRRIVFGEGMRGGRPRRRVMMSTVIGGAMLPHAPQFFTMPETEDKKVVAHVREVAADIGKKLRALKPDLWIIFSNDHAEQFFHTSAPPFTVHVGGEATGEFAGRKFHWKIPSEIGFEVVRALYRQNFDPAFTST